MIPKLFRYTWSNIFHQEMNFLKVQQKKNEPKKNK